MVSQTGTAQGTAPRHARAARWLPIVLSIFVLAFLSAAVGAQIPQDSDTPPTEQILASYEGQPVTTIDIAGRPDLKVAEFTSEFAQQPGQAFDKQKVDRTAAALKAAGHFQNVRVHVEPEAKGLRVLFVIEPAVYYGIFQFPGAERFTYTRLVQVANYVSQSPYNATEVEHDRQSLLRFFQQTGYFQAQVSTELKIDARREIVNVIFHSDLGRRATSYYSICARSQSGDSQWQNL
jgi:outer membrane protein insertion porin family